METRDYIATFLPLVLGYFASLGSAALAKEHWPKEIVGLLTVAITAVVAFGTQFIQEGNYSFTLATLKALGAYVIAAEARARVWNTDDENGLSARLLAFPRKLPTRTKPQRYGGGVPDDDLDDDSRQPEHAATEA